MHELPFYLRAVPLLHREGDGFSNVLAAEGEKNATLGSKGGKR